MAFNFNKAVYDDSKNGDGFKNSDYQKMFNDDAPTLGYISSKAPCEFLLVPPHPSYGASSSLTSGGFRQDKDRGTMPTLGQYGIDWVMVYRKVGNNPDQKKRKDILAINMIDGEDGMVVQTERDWGNGYKSPMYILREYLWKCGGGHKYDKNQRRSIPTINVDTSSNQYRRAQELVPIDGNDLSAPLGRASRTMFLQGFMMNNAGICYTVDDEGQPCWPKHKILMINQLSAIKSREDARTKEGFYDAWFERTDGVPMDPATIMATFGDVSVSEESLTQWEQGFKHNNYATTQKLVTFQSYPSGPAGIATYACGVKDSADRFGPNYILPDDLLKKVRPFSDYILQNNRELQIQWLLEQFPGDEWAFKGAGIISDGSNQVSMAGTYAEDYTPTAPVVAAPVSRPMAPRPMAPTSVPPRTASPMLAPELPKPNSVIPRVPSAVIPTGAGSSIPAAAPAAGGPTLSQQMKAMMEKLHGNNQ